MAQGGCTVLERVRRSEPYDPERSIFVDDSPAVLAAARAAGIRWVIGVRHPDSQGTVRDHGTWPAVTVSPILRARNPALPNARRGGAADRSNRWNDLGPAVGHCHHGGPRG